MTDPWRERALRETLAGLADRMDQARVSMHAALTAPTMSAYLAGEPPGPEAPTDPREAAVGDLAAGLRLLSAGHIQVARLRFHGAILALHPSLNVAGATTGRMSSAVATSCARCGQPLATDQSGDPVCNACLGLPPGLPQMRAPSWEGRSGGCSCSVCEAHRGGWRHRPSGPSGLVGDPG